MKSIINSMIDKLRYVYSLMFIENDFLHKTLSKKSYIDIEKTKENELKSYFNKLSILPLSIYNESSLGFIRIKENCSSRN